jgi:hypothetical protein
MSNRKRRLISKHSRYILELGSSKERENHYRKKGNQNKSNFPATKHQKMEKKLLLLKNR